MLYFDSETFSETPIKHGTYRYVQNAECMIATWAEDDGPVQCWDATLDPEIPADLRYLLTGTDDLITAHNAMFDRNILKYALHLETKIERWRCSMVQGLAHALPGGLEKQGVILGLDEEVKKHDDGKDLVRLFCSPRPKNSKLRRATRLTHPEQWAQFLAYAKADVEAMRAICKKQPKWNMGPQEIALYHLDQKVNDRGICIDLDLAKAALRAVEKEQKVLAAQCSDATDGVVESATKRDQLLEHILAEYGVGLPNMQMSTLERRINDPDIPEGVKELLRIRLQASSTSTSKYKTLLRSVSTDGRLRGTLQFDGAGRTRRDAGRTFQPQNLPSRGIMEPAEVEVGIEAMKLGCEDLLYPNVMLLATSAIRGCIIAPPGKKLVVSDLSNIEGRDAAWLAQEEWKLQAFRDYDTIIGYDEKGKPIRKGPDIYKLAYAKSFGVDPDFVDSNQRDIGKRLELSMGYGGGVGAFVTFSAIGGADLEAMADGAWEILPADVVHEAEGFYDWTLKKSRPTFGLSRRAYVVCDVFKRLWRHAHPYIVATWKALEENCIAATNHPGETFTAGRFKIRRDGAWLRVALPSGRCLCYPSPQVSDKRQLSFMGSNQYTRQWQRIKTHGAKVFENSCQGLARDVMFDNLQRIEDHEYEIITRVHDEVPTEAPDRPEFNPEHLSSLLATNHAWCPDLPLAAAGFESYRYKKG